VPESDLEGSLWFRHEAMQSMSDIDICVRLEGEDRSHEVLIAATVDAKRMPITVAARNKRLPEAAETETPASITRSVARHLSRSWEALHQQCDHDPSRSWTEFVGSVDNIFRLRTLVSLPAIEASGIW
jgi:hypothetical protein